MQEKHKLPPNPARLIEGLRDTGYDFNTALADIVDNSVDAGASNIDIGIKMDMSGRVQIYVADDGCGMNREDLLNGMTYGAVGKPDAKRLGKFGLGMKTASTAFCRRLAVTSRSSGQSEPITAVWDLDHVVTAAEWELIIEKPDASDLEILDQVSPSRAGTLVIWDKVDRLLKNYKEPNGKHARRALENRIQAFKEHAEMVYQRFLDPADSRARNVSVVLNGDRLVAWDPFCIGEDDTEVVGDATMPVVFADGREATFGVKAFVLPRKEHFSTKGAASSARLSNKNQGVYVYRENRLILPHNWMGVYSKEPHYSLLRVEFSFNHDLDEAFHVDIKKSKIALSSELYEWLANKFLPAPRNAANERYRKGQRRATQAASRTAHDGSNRAISEKEPGLINSKIEVENPDSGEVRLSNKEGTLTIKLDVSSSSEADDVCVVTVPGIEDGMLWKPMLSGTRHAVAINTGHEYYKKVYVPNHSSGVTIQGMDSLLWGLAEAELSTINSHTQRHFKELRFEVSKLLRELVEELPEPELEE